VTKSIDKVDFYDLLSASAEFTSELGKMTLEVGRLEVILKSFLCKTGIKTNLKSDTLGLLVAKLCNCRSLTSYEISRFNDLRKQRNFLTHNMYAIQSNRVEDLSLTVGALPNADVDAYIQYVIKLRKDIGELIDILLHKKHLLSD